MDARSVTAINNSNFSFVPDTSKEEQRADLDGFITAQKTCIKDMMLLATTLETPT